MLLRLFTCLDLGLPKVSNGMIYGVEAVSPKQLSRLIQPVRLDIRTFPTRRWGVKHSFRERRPAARPETSREWPSQAKTLQGHGRLVLNRSQGSRID